MEPIHETATAVRERLCRQLELAPDHTPQNSECRACQGLGYITVPDKGVCRCECQRQKILQQKLSEIPERFRDATFENYVPTDAKQEAAQAIMLADFTRSYFLFGDYARGKTHLATAQYRKLIAIERPCLFMTMAELISELRRAEWSAAEPDYFCLVRERSRHADRFHLFVDDIDKFKVTDFKFEVLFDLVDTIYKRKLGLTVTSNYSLRELVAIQALHPAIVRRLDDLCLAVEV